MKTWKPVTNDLLQFIWGFEDEVAKLTIQLEQAKHKLAIARHLIKIPKGRP